MVYFNLKKNGEKDNLLLYILDVNGINSSKTKIGIWTVQMSTTSIYVFKMKNENAIRILHCNIIID